MPRKITQNTYGLSEEEVCKLGNSELKAKAHSKGLNEDQMKELKSYRRLLRIRCYGKRFRTKERDEINTLKFQKEILMQEKIRLERELKSYRHSAQTEIHIFDPFKWADN
ncbi:hypothetical protein LOD99_5802 [Oopsacas minuta]|uniref:Basic leucine zipper domain-containing protein n=1 Tax=Oopsacas minuta TaxID=111878 RepID=A0AAV7JQK2_9METZ|nr:hypothetical protein LOD99_5802 [Oopsacas minuta]